ncbi:MAG: DUF3592 domain-containing protein [Elusimicrobia bacterium]|nr:DUF3592 domain-containing protein [Elusimicrobiota bacterium]
MDELRSGYSRRQQRALAFAGSAAVWIRRVFVYLGLFMFLITGSFLWKLRGLYTGGQSAAGSIAGFRESRGSAKDRGGRQVEYSVYYPVIRFEAEGKSWEVVSGNGSRGGPAFREGQEVEVVYKPGSPQKAELARPVKTFSTLWTTALLFFSAGLAFFLAGRFLLPRLFKSFAPPGPAPE